MVLAPQLIDGETSSRLGTPTSRVFPDGSTAPQGKSHDRAADHPDLTASVPAGCREPATASAQGPPQPYGNGPVPPPGFPPAYPPLPPAPKRSTGKIVGIVAAVLVLLGGLGAAALFVFGPRTVDPASVQQEIVRITQTAVGVVPADVRCPAEIRAEAGGTFACTATVDGQPVDLHRPPGRRQGPPDDQLRPADQGGRAGERGRRSRSARTSTSP